jgi:hypothetical protein
MICDQALPAYRGSNPRNPKPILLTAKSEFSFGNQNEHRERPENGRLQGRMVSGWFKY